MFCDAVLGSKLDCVPPRDAPTTYTRGVHGSGKIQKHKDICQTNESNDHLFPQAGVTLYLFFDTICSLYSIGAMQKSPFFSYICLFIHNIIAGVCICVMFM